MNDPVAYVSTWRIAGGKLDDFRRLYSELVKVVEENEPRTSAFLAFANDDLTELTYVHVFSDNEALDRHMAVLGEKMKLLPGDITTVMQLMQPVGIQVFGAPAGRAAEMDDGLARSGVPFTGKRRYLGGFTRP